MELYPIGARIAVKDRNKVVNRYCLEKSLKKHGRADLKIPNKNSYSIEELAVIRPKCYIKKTNLEM